MTDDDLVRTIAYATAFANAVDRQWDAIDSGPDRLQSAIDRADVARCKAIAEGAVRRRQEPT